jgi:NAD(P)-dependent dehydrogenase (short-subunit alcohol dehydrogenase family)
MDNKEQMMGELLKNRIAVVTGAGSGLGRAEAKILAAQGASVVVNDIGAEPDGRGVSRESADRVVDEIISAGGKAVPNYDSVATEKGAENIIKTAIDQFGRISFNQANDDEQDPDSQWKPELVETVS